ncbi:hypothetical protein [Pedobacter sp. Leaf250]|uniref:hypothetical protein n=1 Tax=Pedobacter sp. Leaf250 TaxID=2876559 RepID=UPI001E30EE6C|nr:hypothetical protein [Pedobacter sp. Leaf250]
MIDKVSDKLFFKLLQTNVHQYSGDCIDEFYQYLISKYPDNVFIKDVGWLKFKVLWIGIFRRLLRYFKPRILLPINKKINFSAQIGPDLKMCIPDFFLARQNYIYMFDAWPRFHHELGEMFDLMNVKTVFFSSRDVTYHYQKNTDSICKAYWVPEGINATEYHYLPYTDKTIDVLEFGRTYKSYHDIIVGPLAEARKQHLFTTADKRILFETKLEFKNALSKTKICICVPSNITHPERAENISTMTLRYLQCMASKCLIVGIMPPEMNELFDYMPMIEIDSENPGLQIMDILTNYESYHHIIERNYQIVNEKHQWLNRWKFIEEIIKKEI